MKKTYYIITGTSRGIGESLAQQLVRNGEAVISISRTYNPKLKVQAKVQGSEFSEICFDLSHTEKIHELAHSFLRLINPEEVDKIILINNAGTVHPIKPIGSQGSVENVYKNVQVNFMAPVLLTHHLIRTTNDWGVERRILNISSGAAKRPVFGWSSYCSSKAALNMFSECLSVEQQDVQNPVKIVAFAPGVVDTEMQEEIRDTNKKDFAELEKFQSRFEKGELLKPSYVAKQIIELVNSPDFGEKVVRRIDEDKNGKL